MTPSGFGGAAALVHCRFGYPESEEYFHFVLQVKKDNASLFQAVQNLKKKGKWLIDGKPVAGGEWGKR